MIKNLKIARKKTGIPCKILMDLMGPKLRTGPLKEGPKMLEIHPGKILGNVTEPAKVWRGPSGQKPPKNMDISVPVDAKWLTQLKSGDKIKFKDTGGRKRCFLVKGKRTKGVIVELYESSYIKTGMKIRIKTKSEEKLKSKIGELPRVFTPIILKKGNILELTKEQKPGEPAIFNSKWDLIKAAHISCTLPKFFPR